MCLIGLMCATSSYAGCDGGIAVAGFCKSNVKMNWWSAAAWCKGNAMQLATIYEMCPSWDGVYMGTCLELNQKGEGYVWTSTAFQHDCAFMVRLSDGLVAKDDRDSSEHGYAFCK